MEAPQRLLLMLFLIGVGLNIAVSQSSTTFLPTSTSTIPTTTQDVCSSSNSSCEVCVKHASCLWCESNPVYKCIPYPAGAVLPTSVCSLSDARWGVCWVNYEILLIVMCVLAFVIIITVVTCVYCCCCKIRRRYNTRREQRDTERENIEKAERETRNAERRAERQAKYDDIRRKYGLKKDDNVQYNRFENEVC